MSIRTTGGEQHHPFAVSTGRKAAGGKAPAGDKPAAKTSGTTGGRPRRRPVTPVKVHPGRNWGLIALIAAVVVVAVGIIGYGGWAAYQDGHSWQDRASDIDGLVNYREKDPQALKYDKHGLPQAQIDTLAGKVRGKEKMMMSPYEGLDAPISLQAWGYQLKVDNADDTRIDEFIKTMRVNASMEGPNASCAQGITAAGSNPRDLPPQQEQ